MTEEEQKNWGVEQAIKYQTIRKKAILKLKKGFKRVKLNPKGTKGGGDSYSYKGRRE